MKIATATDELQRMQRQSKEDVELLIQENRRRMASDTIT
jgi:hypothetical protein